MAVLALLCPVSRPWRSPWRCSPRDRSRPERCRTRRTWWP